MSLSSRENLTCDLVGLKAKEAEAAQTLATTITNRKASEVLRILVARQAGERFREPKNLDTLYYWVFSLRYGSESTAQWTETPFPVFLGLIEFLNKQQLIDLSASQDVFNKAVSSFDGRTMNRKIYEKCGGYLARSHLAWAQKCLQEYHTAWNHPSKTQADQPPHDNTQAAHISCKRKIDDVADSPSQRPAIGQTTQIGAITMGTGPTYASNHIVPIPRPETSTQLSTNCQTIRLPIPLLPLKASSNRPAVNPPANWTITEFCYSLQKVFGEKACSVTNFAQGPVSKLRVDIRQGKGVLLTFSGETTLRLMETCTPSPFGNSTTLTSVCDCIRDSTTTLRVVVVKGTGLGVAEIPDGYATISTEMVADLWEATHQERRRLMAHTM